MLSLTLKDGAVGVILLGLPSDTAPIGHGPGRPLGGVRCGPSHDDDDSELPLTMNIHLIVF